MSRILVAVDHSEPARAAFARALALARTHASRVMVVHAVPAAEPFGWRAKERLALLARLRDEAQAAGVHLDVAVQHGDPAQAILVQASSARPDLVIVGTHKRNGLERLRAGSIAERVARRAGTSVLIVPASPASSSGPGFENVVVGVDLRTGSGDAIDAALPAVSGARGRVTLVHVVRNVPANRRSAYTYHFSVPEYVAWLARDAWRRLRRTIGRTGPDGRVHARVMTGDPAIEIERVAAEIGADLVIVGATRRTWLGGWFAPRMARRVIQTAARPVLVVPDRSASPAPAPPEPDRLRPAA